MKPHCCGIIIFDSNNIRTVIVKTPRGYLGFPKGKREGNESDLECAFRETLEETGLDKDDLILTEQYIDEISKKGSICVRYFIAHLKNDNVTFKWDLSELSDVQWYSIDDIYNVENIKEIRKNILKSAHHIITNTK